MAECTRRDGTSEASLLPLFGTELEIDDEGRVWRIGLRHGGRGRVGSQLVRCQRRRAETLSSSGYLQVRSMVNGVRRHAGAHRLVWLHFHGPIPPWFTINHINGRKDDNRPVNLELASDSEQQVHAFATGLKSQAGERNNAAKLTTATAAEIRSERAAGVSLKVLAVRFGVSDRTISKVALRQRWVA